MAPNTDLSRITQGYDVKRETKIIHWAGALPDKNSRVRPPYPKPWQDNEDSNPVTKLWYKYKKEMLKLIYKTKRLIEESFGRIKV